ncbi:hypothetical protein GALL_499470 [mine drainage metagenome]|uniref:Uncharacterized protein n=1 Tax=mine drainage metagenome TaxID=410659 RepID=A0A1J5PAX7_9ZZZZ
MLLRPCVEEHIAWAGIEAQRAAVGKQQAEIGESAEIEHRDIPPGTGEHCAVEGGNQRRSLAACRHVSAAKIGHHRDACALGQPRRGVDLQGIAAVGPMAHGLAVGADGADCGIRLRTGVQQFGDHLGIDRGQRLRGCRAAVQFVVAHAVERQQFGAQGCGKSVRGVGQHPLRHCLRRVGRGKLHQHAVHPVERGAAHQTDRRQNHRNQAPAAPYPRTSSLCRTDTSYNATTRTPAAACPDRVPPFCCKYRKTRMIRVADR